jgi:hypothetical protein
MPQLDDEQERRSTLLLPQEGSSLGRLAPRGAGWASPNAAAARRLLKPLLRAFYPSLPEPRRRHRPDPVGRVRGVSMSPSDAVERPWRPADLRGGAGPDPRSGGPAARAPSRRVRAPRTKRSTRPSTRTSRSPRRPTRMNRGISPTRLSGLDALDEPTIRGAVSSSRASERLVPEAAASRCAAR